MGKKRKRVSQKLPDLHNNPTRRLYQEGDTVLVCCEGIWWPGFVRNGTDVLHPFRTCCGFWEEQTIMDVPPSKIKIFRADDPVLEKGKAHLKKKMPSYLEKFFVDINRALIQIASREDHEANLHPEPDIHHPMNDNMNLANEFDAPQLAEIYLSPTHTDACYEMKEDARLTTTSATESLQSNAAAALHEPYIHPSLNSNDTPMSGNTELQEVAGSCPGLQHPERIKSTQLRKYIATVSQILDMSESELGMLAKHLGHDPKTHREYYRLSHSTLELSKVSQLLLTVENGKVNQWKGMRLEDISVEDLPSIEEEDAEGCDVDELPSVTEKAESPCMREVIDIDSGTKTAEPVFERSRTQKRRWSDKETAILKDIFQGYIQKTRTSVHKSDLQRAELLLNNIRLGKRN